MVLHQQVARLTPLEQTLLTWLEVVREWTSLESLLSLLVKRPTRGRMLEALHTLRRDRLYERLTITGTRGLTEAQKASLRALGAFEETSAGT